MIQNYDLVACRVVCLDFYGQACVRLEGFNAYSLDVLRFNVASHTEIDAITKGR